MVSSLLQLLLLLLLHLRVNATSRSITYELGIVDPAEVEPHAGFEFVTDVLILKASGLLRISTKIRFSSTEDSFPVAYYPSTELFDSFCSRFYAGFASGGSTEAKHEFCQILRHHFQSVLIEAGVDKFRLALWKHNLRDLGPEPPIVIVYSFGAHEITGALECACDSVFSTRYVIVMNKDEFAHSQGHQMAPDVFVFSILDGICNSPWSPWCRISSDTYVKQYSKANRTTLIMVSGEHWNVDELDERVVLLSTVSQVDRAKHVYFPVASTSFAERIDQSPLALLTPYAEVDPRNQTRRFCAYMFARCDRPQREYMFDMLDAIEPVDALGVCSGSHRAPNPSQKRGRENLWFNDEAVKTYELYKFVIAFENGQEPGYVTEKLVNAFLAGSIPVYLGHSETVAQIFNSRSFIDCGQFRTLRDCAARVKEVHESPKLYAQMRLESPVANASAFYDAFSWHPDIPSTFVSDALRVYCTRS